MKPIPVVMDPSTQPPASVSAPIYEQSTLTSSANQVTTTPPTLDTVARPVSIAGPSVKAMLDLEALDRVIESALAAKPPVAEATKPTPATPATPVTPITPSIPVSTPNNVMTSIDSSRHALKFKIKGPFLDANYSSGSTSTPTTMNANNTTSTPATDSSNLRRMRKKELIRQYVSQDVTTPAQQPSHLHAFLHFPYSSALAYANEEYLLAGSNDLSEVIGSTNVGTLPASSNLNQQGGSSGASGMKSHVSIPKAVASMGSLGSLGDDFGASSAAMDSREGKRRRRGNTNPPLSRELRNLQMSQVDPASIAADQISDAPIGRRKDRRRGRPAAHAPAPASSAPLAEGVVHPPPKLKIRFREKEVVSVYDPASGMNVPTNPTIEMMVGISSQGKAGRPPKKRLSDSGCDIPKPMTESGQTSTDNNPPTLEDLWRQSMKFREEVMADFSKSERRKGKPDEPSRQSETPPVDADSKPEFKNRRHKTKTRKDRSKSKDRDGNNRRRPPPVSTDLVSIAGGGSAAGVTAGAGEAEELTELDLGRKRKRNNSGNALNDSGDGNVMANGVQIISRDGSETSSAPPKLIIRFGKKPVGQPQQQPADADKADTVNEDITPPPPLQKADPEALHRLMPIKLKLARCSQGYVTKSKSDSTPPPSPTPTPKESCQVR